MFFNNGIKIFSGFLAAVLLSACSLVEPDPEPKVDVKDYMYNEIRFRSLRQLNPEAAETYLEQARKSAERRYKQYKFQAERPL